MIRLGVNIDHVATVRQARRERYPDPVQAALLAELGGADNITCHLREDRRHIQDRDLFLLKDTIKIPLNFEMAATKEMVGIAKQVKPHAVTLVPEKREELTTEGGLDVSARTAYLKDVVCELREAKVLVSLFVEANQKMIELSKEIGAQAVEIHTGTFCRDIDEASSTREKMVLVKKLAKISESAFGLDLQVHFGHGLNFGNAFWLQLVNRAEEANIGHAIVGRAIFVGLEKAVFEMKQLLNDPCHKPITY
jgi:pyridoxine 5-phosphate synthase